ncbi:MAG: C1 family peptidase [Candidatus Rifleibacteriota bacterium]
MRQPSIHQILLAGLMIISMAAPAPAQIRPADLSTMTGSARLSPEEYLKLQQVNMMRCFTTPSGKPADRLPASADLSAHFPPVQRQSDQSCMAWTNAYAIKSFHERREHGWDYGPNHLFSPSFMFNLLHERDAKGDYPKSIEAMKFMIEYGAVPLSLFPYQPGDFTLPSPELQRFAKAFRALSYRRLPTDDLQMLRAMLASGEPVAISVPIYQEFLDLNKRNPIFKKHRSNEVLSVHEMVVVGYDDKKNAFKLYNYWGTEWGDNGYGWVDYSLWNSDFIWSAVVTYDRPTPPEVVAWLKNADQKPAGPLPDFAMPEIELPLAALSRDDATTLAAMADAVASYTAGRKGPQGTAAIAARKLLSEKVAITVLPDEGGISFADGWLRLGDPLPAGAGAAAREGINIQQSFLSPDEIGRFDFTPGTRAVATGRGVRFGTDRATVSRLYSAPDEASPEGLRETYYYAAAAKDMGGVSFSGQAALEFGYSRKGEVNRISLFTVFLPALTGKAMKAVDESEISQKPAGKAIISKEGKFSFEMPEAFAKIDKVVWPGIGVGYFIKEHPLNSTWAVTIKVFEVKDASKEKLLAERIPADMKVYSMLGLKAPVSVTFAGREWQFVEDASGAFINYYTVAGGRYYQVNVATDVRVSQEKWLASFLESISPDLK